MLLLDIREVVGLRRQFYYRLYYPYQEVTTLSSFILPQARDPDAQWLSPPAAIATRAGSYPGSRRGKPAPTATP